MKAVDQNVPARGVGEMVQWSKALGASNAFSAGSDWRWVDGDSREDAYVLCSLAADLKISQIVDQPNWGVSAYMSLAVFTR